jgi:hypothetical protein
MGRVGQLERPRIEEGDLTGFKYFWKISTLRGKLARQMDLIRGEVHHV